MSSHSQKATIPSYQDIAQATFGTLWPEATPQDWALVVHKLREALAAQQAGPSDYAELLAFKNKILDIAAKRQRGYAERKHGGLLNHQCMDEVVQASLDQSRRDIGKPASSEAGAERDPNDPDPVEHARELAAALIEARKELVEIRPEAARYRWLRERPFGADFEHSSIEKGAGWALIFCMPEGSTISANLDKSLDEAMASSNATHRDGGTNG